MFVVFLEFSENRTQAGRLMEAHKDWLAQGFDDGVFLLAGSLQPAAGGALLAKDTSLEALELRLAADPFVSENVVAPVIREIAPSRADERLAFLLG